MHLPQFEFYLLPTIFTGLSLKIQTALMKRTLFPFIILALFLVSCSKEKSGNTYYFNFKANGQTVKFTGYIAAGWGVDNGFKTLTILGAPNASASNDYLGLYLANYPGNNEITTGMYRDTAHQYLFLSTYAQDGIDYESGQTLADEAETNSITLANPLKLTISSLTSNSVQGTFEGDYYVDADPVNGQKVTITEGKFNVKIQ
jgi:hypothetical protein